MTAVRLPVTGMDVRLRLPAGADDLFLLEAGPPDLAVALAFLGRVVRRAGGEPLDAASLPIGDVDALLLRLRQKIVGDTISGETLCAAPGCRARVDVTFSIAAYLDHHRPSTPASASPADEGGWHRLGDTRVEFRLPTADDQFATVHAPEPEQVLLRRCVRPAGITAAEGAEAEAAMEAMAPSLFSDLEGRCPACEATVEVRFDPLEYALRELRDQAAFVYHDVSAIARCFHWSEAEILALPAARRARYAELAAAQHGWQEGS